MVFIALGRARGRGRTWSDDGARCLGRDIFEILAAAAAPTPTAVDSRDARDDGDQVTAKKSVALHQLHGSEVNRSTLEGVDVDEHGDAGG